jgi:hypothetical protein
MALDVSPSGPLEELRKMLADLSADIRGLRPPTNIETARIVLPKYNDVFDRLNKILDKFAQDIESFVKLDIKTQITDVNGKVIAVYETIYEINGNITETFPQSTDPAILTRHNELADKSIQERKEVLVDIVKIIAEILKFPLP